MSRNIDQRIVEMKFENGKFKNDVKDTIDSLQKLKKETDLKDLQQSAKDFDLSNVNNEVNKLKFTFADVFKFTAFKNISESIQTNVVGAFKSAFNEVESLWNKTLNQIKSGGWARATNIDQATFQLKGLGIEISRVNSQIEAAVNDTAYGYDQAAKAASQLAASQVKIGDGFKTISFKNSTVVKENVDEMERALGAISGIAAMTNSQFDDIADIFTDAAGRGKVSADTFNRIAQRGLNSAAALATSMGKSEAAVKDLASKGKISFQEFADAMYETFFLHAKDANATFEGSLANMKSALSRVGQPFAKTIRSSMIEPFNELKETIKTIKSQMEKAGLYEYFNNLALVLSKVFTNFVSAFRKNESNFEWIGNLTQVFKNLVETVLGIAIPIKDAFKSIFGKSVIQGVNSLTKGFADFTEKLIPTKETVRYIQMAFEGLFQIFKSFGSVIGQVISGLTGLDVEGTSLIGWLLKAVAIGLKILGVISETIVSLIDVKGVINFVSNAINYLISNIKNITVILGGGFVAAVYKAYVSMRDFLGTLKTKVSGSSNPIQTVITELLSKLKELPPLLSKALSSIKYFFNEFVSATPPIQKVIVSIKEFVNSLGLIDTLKSKFEGFAGVLESFLSFLLRCFGSIGAVTVQAAELNSAVDELSGTKGSKWDTSGIQSFILKMKEFVTSIDYGKVAIIGFIALITSIILNVRKLIKSFTAAANSITGVFGSVKTLCDTVGGAFSRMTGNIGESIKNYVDSLAEANKHKTTLNEIATSLLKVSGAIAILVAALMALSLFSEKHDLGGAGEILLDLSLGIISFTAALAILNKCADLGFLVKFSAVMLTMAASMGILVASMNSLKLDNVEVRMAVLGILMFELAAVATMLSQYANQLVKGSLSLISFALTLQILAKALNLVPGLIEMSGEVIILGTLLYGASLLLGKAATSFAETIKEFAIAMAAMGASILLFVISARMLNEIPDITNGLLNLALIMAEVLAFSYVMIKINKTLGDNEMPKFNASMLILAAAVSILARSVKMLSELDPYACLQGTLAMVALFGMIAVLMKVSEYTEKAHPVKFAASLVLITGCIGLLAGLVAITGLINEEQLGRGISVVGGLLAMITVLCIVSKFTEKANFKAITAALIAVNVIMVEIMILSLLKDWNGILNALGVMATVMVAFGVLMYAIGKGNYDKNTANALLAMVVIVGEIGVALWALSTQCNWGALIASAISISMVMKSFGNLMSTISSKSGLKPEKMTQFLKASLILIPIGAALWAISRHDWGSILAAGASISMTIKSFSDLISTISSKTGIKQEKINAFLTASLAFIPIGAALWAVSLNDWGSILAAGASISGSLFVFSKVLEQVSKQKFDIKQIGTFVLATLAFVPIGAALWAVSRYDWGSILAAGAAMSASVIAIAAALKILSGIDFISLGAAAASMVASSLGMMAIAHAMVQFTLVNWGALGIAVLTIGALVVALYALGSGSAITLIGAAALVIAAAALDLIALAMMGAAKAFQMFTPALALMAALPLQEIASGLVPLSGSLILLAAAGVALSLGAVGLLLAAKYMPSLGAGLLILSKVGSISHIPGPLALIGAAGIALALGAPGMALAGAAMKVLAVGIDALSKSVSKAATVISSGITLIVSTLKMGARLIKTYSNEMGVNVGAGLISGIVNSKTSVIKSGSGLANCLISAVKSTLDINSPSKVMQWLGKMCGVGFSEGSTDIDVWNGIKKKITSNLNGSVLAPAVEVVGKLKGVFNSLTSTTSGVNLQMDKLPISVQNTIKKMNEAKDSGSYLEKIMKSLGIETIDTSEIMNQMTDATSGLTESLTGEGGAASAAKETEDAFTKLKDTLASQMDIFSEFTKDTDLSTDQLLSNMKSQIDGMTEWSTMLAKLSFRGINQGLLQKLAEMGPQGYKYVNAFVNMTNEQLSEANALYAKSLLMPDATAKYIQDSYTVAGMWATQGFTNGLDMEKFKSSGKEGADAVREGFEGKNGLQINSPSLVMYANGQYAVMGFIDGLNDMNRRGLVPTSGNIADNFVRIFKSKCGKATFEDIGVNIIRGLIQGLSSQEKALRDKVEYLAKIPASITKSVNKIASPSKLMRKLGGYITEGLAIGIEDNQNLVGNASETIASTTITGLKDAIKAISTMDDMGVDLNPTITPVLDLSNVEKGSQQIDAMSKDWNGMQIGVSSNLASTTATGFNTATIAKANLALENQNGIDMLKSAINALGNSEAGMTQNNTFNISGDDPRAIADEVSRVLQMQVERRGAVWA